MMTKRFSSVYDLSNSKIAIKLNYTRTINVNIVGEVFYPGSYTIPAMNTAFNALFAAKGITDLGSVRTISISRAGKTIKELSKLMKIKESEIEERIKILMFYNIVISLPDNYYKYIEPYGTVDCEDALPVSSKSSEIKYVKFTDIIMTVESRIMKEVKSRKRNKMELEQSIQEFLGSEYSRSIYYNQLESLKKRFYIEEKGDYIEYII
jgi:protein involved in polysaccharide export with SLBB domain